ncbi:hypothetical protein [Sphingobacterium bambusae]
MNLLGDNPKEYRTSLKGFDERNLGYIKEDFSNEDGEVVKPQFCTASYLF